MSRSRSMAIVLTLVLAGGLFGLTRLADGTDWPLFGTQIRAQTVSSEFELVLVADRRRYAPDVPIRVWAKLTYRGPDDQIVISGQRALISFGASRPDGLQFGIAWDDVGAEFLLDRNVSLDRPFAVGYGYGEDDPFVDVYRAFERDPQHRLPPGRYELKAATEFRVGDQRAGAELMPMEVSLSVEVE